MRVSPDYNNNDLNSSAVPYNVRNMSHNNCGWVQPLTRCIVNKIVCKVLPFLLLGVFCGCQNNKPHVAAGEPVKTPSAVNSTVKFPEEQTPTVAVLLPGGQSPTRVFTTSSSSLVIKAATGDYRALYSWEPGKESKLIVESSDLDVTRLSDDTFAAWYSKNNRQAFVTLNAHHLISQPLMLPKGGPTGWGACEGDTLNVVCIGDRPEMKVADGMMFSAVLVIDLVQRKTSWFPVKYATHHRFDVARKTIYVGDDVGPSSHWVKAFDLTGNALEAADFSDIVPRSPSGHFAESLQEDGAESWEIRNASNNEVLLAFNCDKPECKVGDRSENQWNPVFKDQVVVLHNSDKPYGKGSTCDVYKCSPPQLLKSVPCDRLPHYDWSRDGREIITIEYSDGEYHRQPVN